MSSLLIITGPPGAGKSTVAKILADRVDVGVLVEGDAFFGFLASGSIAPWLPESNDQNLVVTRAAAAATARFVEGGYHTIYDGVVGPWFLPSFIDATGLTDVDYVVLLPSVEDCLTRVRERVGHGFDDEGATRKMHEEFAGATVEARHVLVDPPDRPDAVADLIEVAAADGSLSVSLTAS